MGKVKTKRFVARVSDEDDAELNRICKKLDIKRADLIVNGTLKEAKKLEREFDKKNGN